MSKKIELNVKTRQESGSAFSNRIRKSGLIPAIIYARGAESRKVLLSNVEWAKSYNNEVHLVSLKLDEKDSLLALIKEVQYDFITGGVMHVDLQEVKKDQIITATIPVHAGLVPPVGISQGGILDQVLYEVEVKSLPDDLPESITVDISKLGIGQAIHVRELPLPSGVTAVSHAELVVFHVQSKGNEEEAKAGEGEAKAEPELVKPPKAAAAADAPAGKDGKAAAPAKKK